MYNFSIRQVFFLLVRCHVPSAHDVMFTMLHMMSHKDCLISCYYSIRQVSTLHALWSCALCLSCCFYFIRQVSTLHALWSCALCLSSWPSWFSTFTIVHRICTSCPSGWVHFYHLAFLQFYLNTFGAHKNKYLWCTFFCWNSFYYSIYA